MSDDSFEEDKQAKSGNSRTPRRTTRSARKQNLEELQMLEDALSDDIEDSAKEVKAKKAAQPVSKARGNG